MDIKPPVLLPVFLTDIPPEARADVTRFLAEQALAIMPLLRQWELLRQQAMVSELRKKRVGRPRDDDQREAVKLLRGVVDRRGNRRGELRQAVAEFLAIELVGTAKTAGRSQMLDDLVREILDRQQTTRSGPLEVKYDALYKALTR